NGVFIRAQRIWTITSMLASLVRELGGQPTRFKQPMFDFIVQTLAATGRPLFVDEADYLDTNMIDVIRDIYDCSRVPVILVGMDDIARGLANNKRFMRRITQEVKFNPLDLADTKVVSDTVCEIPVDEDLLAKLQQESNGNIGLISNGLDKIEQHAKTNGLDRVTFKDWGGRRLFFDNRSV
ncbi:MAG: ATP-binding protein, partial [Desulfobulbaceae bacterium]|nr:ATP-binding protein [Desulfobulbaceae bacterium]